MSGVEQKEIDRARVLIDESTFDPDAKEGLHRLLDTAQNEPSETLRCLSTQWVRHVVNMRQTIKEEIELHVATCPMKDMPKGKIGVVLQVAKSWPACIAIVALAFSPHLPMLMEKIFK